MQKRKLTKELTTEDYKKSLSEIYNYKSRSREHIIFQEGNMEIEEKTENLWKLYPKKYGKDRAIKKIPKILKKISYEELTRAV